MYHSTSHRRRTSRAIRVLGVGAVLAVTLAGCSTGEKSGESTSATPVSGGNLRFVQDVFPTCIDVAQSAYAPYAAQHVVDNLLDQDPETGEIVPWLATSYEIENGGTRYVLHLQDGVTFSDGTALDAIAVKDNFDTIVRLGTQGVGTQAAGYLVHYAHSEVVDPLTIAVDFTEPRAGFLQALAEKPLGIIAPASLAETPENRCANGVIGSGAFTISQIVKGDKIVLSRRPDYDWASSAALHSGPAYLDTITISTAVEESVRTGALLGGQGDVIWKVPPADLPRVESANFTVLAAPSGGIAATLYPNLSSPVVSDLTVRQAISAGIDRQELIDTLYTSYDHAATSIFSTTVPGYTDLSDQLQADPDKAKRLLEEDGWIAGSDGIRVKNGNRLSVNLTSSTAQGFASDFELLQQQLKQIGVELTISLLSSAEYTERVNSGNYDFVYYNLTRPDPDVLLSSFSSAFNARFKNFPQADLDRALDAVATESDTALRAQRAVEVQQLIVEKAYGIPVKENITTVAFGGKVHDVRLSRPWWPLMYDAWIDAN